MKINSFYDEFSERAIVGYYMSLRKKIAFAPIDPADLYNSELQDVLTAVFALSKAGTPVTPLTLQDSLSKRDGRLRELIQLESDACNTYSIDHHCARVGALARRRRAYMSARGAVAALEADDDDAATSALSEAAASLSARCGASGETTTIAAAAEAAYVIAEKARKEGVTPGIQTSLQGWNEKLGGIRQPRLIVIGARPRMGKSALSLQLAADVGGATDAKTQRKCSALFFSLEMGAAELGQRQLASASRVSAQRIDRAQYDDTQAGQMLRAIERMQNIELHIDDRPSLKIGQIRAAAAAAKAEHSIDVVIVDYLQLVRADNRQTNREAEVAEVSRGLKALAKELRVCVIALAQLNRECDKRADRRPNMADLRESGQIEQDADVIALLYREAAYPDRPDADPNATELIVGKNRQGTCGTIRLEWDGPTQTFRDAAPSVWMHT